MKFLIKTIVLILVIVAVVNVYKFALSVKEQKISAEVIKKMAAEKIAEVSNRYKKITCPYCSGCGKIGSGSLAKTCPICKGRGYGIIARSGPDVFICPNPPIGCGGMGCVLKNGKAKRCELCSGLGYGIKK